jgi:glucose/arabinose dehydrogenase
MRLFGFLTCGVVFLSNALLAQKIQFPTVSLVPLISGVGAPTFATDAGDNSGRLFIVEQGGLIRIHRDGALLETPFLDIRDRVMCCGEEGLLSVAFPLSFSKTQRFYVYYTDFSGDITISRFYVSADPDVADPNSETVLLTIEHRQFGNHNGGQLEFGPYDGYLYAGTGDGGGAGDPLQSGQDLSVLLGKLLRIDVESGVEPYAIPSNNPFVGMEGVREEIWAYGLRNPWRFSFDISTGDLYIADVGQNLWEEVNFEPWAFTGGANYGWNIMEGFHCYPPGMMCDPKGLTLPIIEYSHEQGDCSITGGYVYRGEAYPQMQGFYFYGDYCTGRIWGATFDGARWQTALLIDANPVLITSFGKDETGNILVADEGGRIYLLAPTQ